MFSCFSLFLNLMFTNWRCIHFDETLEKTCEISHETVPKVMLGYNHINF